MTALEWMEYIRPWFVTATSFASMIGAIVAVIQSARNGKKIASVEIRIDGRLTELLQAKDAAGVSNVALATSTGHAAGVAEERAKTGP